MVMQFFNIINTTNIINILSRVFSSSSFIFDLCVLHTQYQIAREREREKLDEMTKTMKDDGTEAKTISIVQTFERERSCRKGGVSSDGELKRSSSRLMQATYKKQKR